MTGDQTKEPSRLVVIRLVARSIQEKEPFLNDSVNFLYDVNALYEIARLAIDPDYEIFTFSRYAYYRNGRPLKVRDRLRVRRLREESPLEVAVLLTACAGVVGAVWAFVQTYEKIADWPFNREKARLEAKKLELELEEKELSNKERELALMKAYKDEAVLQQRLENRGASAHYRIFQHRLEKSPLRFEDLEIHVEDSESVREERQEPQKEKPKG